MVTHFFDQQDADYRENNKPGDIHLETYRGTGFRQEIYTKMTRLSQIS